MKHVGFVGFMFLPQTTVLKFLGDLVYVALVCMLLPQTKTVENVQRLFSHTSEKYSTPVVTLLLIQA